MTDKKLTKKLAIDTFNASVKRKSLIRYLTVIVDFSSAARKQEMRPNRAIVIKSYLAEFIKDYFDLNPLSQISFIVTYREKAVLISDFVDSPIDHVSTLPPLIVVDQQVDQVPRFRGQRLSSKCTRYRH